MVTQPDPVDPAPSSTPLAFSPQLFAAVGPLAASTSAPGRYPVLSNRVIGWAALALIVVGVGLAIFLLVLFGDGKHADQLAAVQTAGTIVVGAGGAAALWLTARRQQATEIALNQAKDAHVLQEKIAADTRAHQQRVAAATEADAVERRITDLYTKAVDQLGSDKAPVRLGGLYALERLAQDNPGQRQTIVNVLCAYLRMPFTPPAEQPPTEDAPESEHTRFEARTQERQVRLTAQRILATHLRPGDDPGQPLDTFFWPDIDLDLTGATLTDLNLDRCRLRAASFGGAKFGGDAWFGAAKFTGAAQFSEAKFDRVAGFNGAEFGGDAWFGGAEFSGDALFGGAKFSGNAWFSRVKFGGVALFGWAKFTGLAAEFGDAEFGGLAEFGDAEFGGLARFGDAEFGGDAGFVEAEFGGPTLFGGAKFTGAAGFGEAKFDRPAILDQSRRSPRVACWVLLTVPDTVLSQRVWPEGWTLTPVPGRPEGETEGEWGHLTLAPAASAAS